MPDSRSIQNTVQLNKQVRKLKTNEVEVDELIVLLATADAATIRVAEERLAKLAADRLLLENEYEVMLTKALEHRNYVFAMEQEFINANAKMADINDEIQRIIKQEEELFIKTRQFADKEIGIEEFPEFQEFLKNNLRLKELDEELRQVFLAGDNENYTDTVFYFMWDSLRSGVRS